MKAALGSLLIALALLLIAMVGVCMAAPGAPSSGEVEEGITTSFTILIGTPDESAEDKGSVLVLPGTLINSPSDTEDLKEMLAKDYRLAKLHLEAQYMRHMRPGINVEMPATPGDLSLQATLQGLNDSVATYVIEVSRGGEVLASPRISVRRGQRAIVGSRDGEAAPYLFLVVESSEKEVDLHDGELGRKPKILERINPRYPEEARKSGTQGTVVVNAIIASDGTVTGVEIVESPDPLLGEAAREAVQQWRFEPALNKKGEPVDTMISLEVKFRLE